MALRFTVPVSRKSLNLPCMLLGGQSFCWKLINPDVYRGVVEKLVVQISQTDTECHFCVESARQNISEDICCAFLKKYLQLDVPIDGLYKQWSQADPNFARKAELYPGVRVLRQAPLENVLSFICSQNNNISRITDLVEKLCVNFGCSLGTVEGGTFHSFPTLEDIFSVADLESQLRKLSFGYRAAYIAKTVRVLSENGGTDWLLSLRDMSYKDAKQSLLTLPGVGPKVADCICLMSLDKSEVVPVDTHVLQRDYNIPGLKSDKSLSNASYDAITSFFLNLYGDYAGWAHTVLFCADLKSSPGKRPAEADNCPKYNAKKSKKLDF